MQDESIIKSYVWHGEKCFYVSTVDRDSSAMLGPTRFAETIVWEFDWKTNERGALIHMDEGCRGGIRVHLRVCERIHNTGNPEEEE